MRIWRYLNLPKLISLLQTRTLYFVKLAALRDDLFEGTFPSLTQIITDLQMPPSFKRDAVDDLTAFVRENTYVNCWSGNQKESAAMWRLYGTSPGSVAIQSTYDRLVNVLPDAYYVARVRYIDYDHEHFPSGNMLYPGFHKRIEFEFENEVRALKLNVPSVENPTVNLHKLVERIYIRSTEAPWMKDTIKGLLEQHALKERLVVSNIDAPPTRARAPKEVKANFYKARDSQESTSKSKEHQSEG